MMLYLFSKTAVYRSADGSTAIFNIQNAINFTGKTLKAKAASVKYNFPNVTALLGNNSFQFTYNSVLYVCPFNDGLYGIYDIQQAISDFCIDFGVPEDLFSLVPVDSQNKTNILIKTTIATSINFSVGNTLFNQYFGFTGTISTSVTAAFMSTNETFLNLVNNVLFHTSLCGGNTVYSNQVGSDICAVLSINVAPNDIINYNPPQPDKLPIVIGNTQQITVYITDEAGNKLPTQGETWFISFEVE